MKRQTKERRVAFICAIATALLSTLSTFPCAASVEASNSSYGAVESYNAETTSIRGDANFDGNIDASDASKALEIYAENSVGGSYYLKEGDMDGDGSVDASDASTILVMYSTLSTANEPEDYVRVEIFYGESYPIYEEIPASVQPEVLPSTAKLTSYDVLYVLDDYDDDWSEIVSSDHSKRGYIQKTADYDVDMLIDNGPKSFLTREEYIGEPYPLWDDISGVNGISKTELKYGDTFYMVSWLTNGLSKIYLNGRMFYLHRDMNFKSQVLESKWDENPITTTQSPVTTKPTTTVQVPTMTEPATTAQVTTMTKPTTTTKVSTTAKPTTVAPVSTIVEPINISEIVYGGYEIPWSIRKEADINSEVVGYVNAYEFIFIQKPPVVGDWYKCTKWEDDGSTTYGYIKIYDEAWEYFETVPMEQSHLVTTKPTTTTTVVTTTTVATTTTTQSTTVSQTTTTKILRGSIAVYKADGEPWKIRREPSVESEILTEIRYDESCIVMDPADVEGWYRCIMPKNGVTYVGYIMLYDEAVDLYFNISEV